MLRLVILLLVLANAGYFIWTQGYLAALGLAPTEQTEPQRLKAQLKPDSLRLLNGAKTAASAREPEVTPVSEARSAAVTASTDTSTASLAAPGTPASTLAAPEAPPTACWQAGGYTPAQADNLRAALAQLDLPRNSWQLNELSLAGRWLVFMGRYDEAQMARKKTELRALNVEFREVSAPPLGPGLALGTYSSEAAAQQALQDVIRKGVRTAKVAQERAEDTTMSLRLPAVTDAQLAEVVGLSTLLAGKSLQRCE